jgi:NAD(P)-dependent dehydrogenase (short-subunit alcohol dehydrogenase family)
MSDAAKGMVALVTGGTAGIGKAVALGLAQLGMTVAIVGRDRGRGEAARQEIASRSGNSAVEALYADLSSQAAVRELAGAIATRYPRLDVLINNAAVFRNTRTLTSDGIESMFATNHLAPFLLTNLLLAPLRAAGDAQAAGEGVAGRAGGARESGGAAKAAGARVLAVTAPSTVQLDFDNLQGERRFRALTAFGATKMANLLFTYELARRLDGSGVVANAIHPGLVRSDLMREAPAPLRLITRLMSAPPERAAEPIVRVATAPEFGYASGRFYHRAKEISSHPYSRDAEVQRRLWEVSARLTGLSDRGGAGWSGAQ